MTDHMTTPDFQPISLGELIDALGQRKQDQTVRFDFPDRVPTDIDSYRGYYDHLAIGYRHGCDGPKVSDFLATLRGAVGKVFTGYKGGEYVMDFDTPMWVSNYSESHSCCVIGVHGEYETVIATAYCSDWAGGTTRAFAVLFGGLGFGNQHLPADYRTAPAPKL